MSAIMETVAKPTAKGKTESAAVPVAAAPADAVRPAKKHGRIQLRPLLLIMLPPIVGVFFLCLVWEIIAIKNSGIPSPAVTLKSAAELFADPFYSNGPNDQGIGWNVLASLKRVGIGFGLAAVVGIPLGFLIGRFHFLSGMFSPIVSLL
jgi:nitrate/nitrite transport system permease protein